MTSAKARTRERLWRAILARSLPAAPDFELLDRWRAGELAAGEELDRRHAGRLGAFFATKCGGDAGELARRTLLAAVREDPPRDRAGFRTYLFTLARRELHRHLRQRRGAHLDLSIASIADIMAARSRDEGS